MPKQPYREKNIENMSDIEVIMQALQNVGDSFGGTTKVAFHGIANEIKRLKRVQGIQREQIEIQRQRAFALHREKTGEPHSEDDIPF